MAKSEKISNNNYIHEDLALSIFSKLPLKSLKRFGCVNKTCSLLFQNPNFMNVYRTNFISNPRRRHDNNDTSILLLLHQEFLERQPVPHQYDYKVYCSLHSLSGDAGASQRFDNRLKLHLPTPFQEEEEDPHLYILGSGLFIGLLCLHDINKKIVLWNPTIDEFNVIPPSSIESIPPFNDNLVDLKGFGYDHVRDDYKIIRYINFNPIPLWEVYSLRCNSWRKLDDVNISPYLWDYCPNQLLHLDGICHWWSDFEDPIHDERYLVSFDLTNDEFFTTHIPLTILSNVDANFDKSLLLGHFVALNGSFALISWSFPSFTSYPDMTTFHISILGELGVNESWTKLFIVGPLSDISLPIGAGKNADIFFVKDDHELICFDISTQIIEEIGVKKFGVKRLGVQLQPASSQNIVLYKKSLLSIGAINH